MVSRLTNDDPAAKTSCPSKMMLEKSRSERLVPYLSTKAPPRNGSIMLGSEYTVYNRF